jgi:hypothetical protein
MRPTCVVSTVRALQSVPNYEADAVIGATVSEIVTRISPSFIPATIEGSARLPRHVLQFLRQEIGKYPDLGREMLAAAVSDVDAGFRHAGPVRQQRHEIALLDTVVAKIAGDQADPAPRRAVS